MNSTDTLYVAVSFHGFGHIAQTAPVVNELRRRMPHLELVVQCAAPAERVASRFEGRFEHVRRAADFGMRMASSLDVLAEESHADYLAQHREWNEAVRRESRLLAAFRPSVVLSNIPYLSIAAAAHAGIPCAAIASLNWAHTYPAYCRHMEGADRIEAEMLAAYASARVILNPEPSMPMPGLHNLEPIGPIARRGRERRQELAARLELEAGERLVIVFLGGVETSLNADRWPSLPGITWLMPATQCAPRPDMRPLEACGMPYLDVLCSADALITKPGYGGFCEAACNGIPTLYVRRPHWPEEETLVNWLEAKAACLELPRERLEQGELAADLERLWSLPRREPVEPTGVEQAADRLEAILRERRARQA